MRAARRSQQGVVLFIALIVLVAMSLAGIALIRSVDTGTVIAGNLAFRQNSTFVGDMGIEKARTWLMTTDSTSLNSNQPGIAGGSGYWATMQSGVDLLGSDASAADFDWSTATAVTTPAPPTGYSVRYVIHRLCDDIGSSASVHCVVSSDMASAAASTKGAAAYGSYAISASTTAFYRVSVRTVGPRNSVSYVQAVLF